MSIVKRLALTFCAIVFGGVVPWLEWNATHVFNPEWPAHARLHEVWQLATNSLLALYCLFKIWRVGTVGHKSGYSQSLSDAALLTLIVTGGFFIARITQNFYGGSMLRSDGSEPILFGINIGVLGFGVVTLIAALTWMHECCLQAADKK